MLDDDPETRRKMAMQDPEIQVSGVGWGGGG